MSSARLCRFALPFLVLSALAGPGQAGDKERLLADFKKAQALHEQGEYQEAARLYEGALKLAPKVFGKDHKDTATILNNLANVYRDQGKYAEAEPLFRRSLAIRKKKLGANHLDVAHSLNNLANLHWNQGKYAEAEPLYRRSLAIREKKLGANHPDVAQSLNNLALLHRNQGRYAEAGPLYRRSLAIREKKLGADHLDVAQSLNNLANLHWNQGKYAEAEPLYRRSIAIKEKKLGANHPDVAQSLNNLATLYSDQSKYVEAEPLFRRSLAIREKKLGANHPDVGQSLNNLARLYWSQGKYAEAEPLYRRSLAILERKLGTDHPDVAQSLNNLALLYWNQEQFAEAEPLYRRSLAIRERKLSADHPDVAQSLSNLALLYWRQGKYARAGPLYRRSIAINETKLGPDHPEVAQSLNYLALLHAAQEQWDQAADVIERQRRAVRRFLVRELPALPEADQITLLDALDRRNLHVALGLGWERRANPALAARSAAWLLNGKAVAQDALARRVLLQRDTADPTRGPLVEQLLDARRRHAALALAAAKPGQEAARAAALADLEKQQRDVELRLAEASGSTAPQADPWVELVGVRRTLPEGTALVEFARFRNYDFKTGKPQSARYAAWVIPPTGGGEVALVDLGEATAIDAAVARVNTTLAQAPGKNGVLAQQGESNAERALAEPLQALAKLVLHPLLPHIGKSSRWLLSPDGQLWLTPWAALPLPEGDYAVESHTLQLLVSGRDLVAVPDRGKAKAPLVLADPDFDLGRREARQVVKAPLRSDREAEATRAPSAGLRLGNVRRLPYTATEAEEVAPRLQDWVGMKARVFTGKKALESVVKAAKGPRALIISTHGYFLPDQESEPATLDRPGETSGPTLTNAGKVAENPLLRCGLLLAGCNNPRKDGDAGNDGVLTGLEVVGTDLRGTELVVLSACETGIGDVRNGEGVAGLRQAFQLAGAEAVVATLWRIPDRQSAQLMIQFFDGLAAKKDKATALAEAQRAAIKERREKNGAAHPFFWAAFTLTGGASGARSGGK